MSVSGDAVSAAVEGEEMTVDAVVRGAGGDNETEETGSSGGVFTGEILLTGLQAGTEYEATVASSNQFGLGPHGDIFTFTTMQEGEKLFQKLFLKLRFKFSGRISKFQSCI